MRLDTILARIEEALMPLPSPRHSRSPCPECDDRGPHDDNGAKESERAFCCKGCGLHFDAIEP